MMRETAEVINVLSTLSFFVATFFYLHNGKQQDSDVAVCIGTFVILVAGYTIHWSLNRQKMRCSEIAEEFGGFLFLSFILAFLTPVL